MGEGSLGLANRGPVASGDSGKRVQDGQAAGRPPQHAGAGDRRLAAAWRGRALPILERWRCASRVRLQQGQSAARSAARRPPGPTPVPGWCTTCVGRWRHTWSASASSLMSSKCASVTRSRAWRARIASTATCRRKREPCKLGRMNCCQPVTTAWKRRPAKSANHRGVGRGDAPALTTTWPAADGRRKRPGNRSGGPMGQTRGKPGALDQSAASLYRRLFGS